MRQPATASGSPASAQPSQPAPSAGPARSALPIASRPIEAGPALAEKRPVAPAAAAPRAATAAPAAAAPSSGLQRAPAGSPPVGPAQPPAAGAPRAAAAPPGPGPLARSGSSFAGSRPVGGPLSAHTPHRGAAPRPGGAQSGPAGQREGGRGGPLSGHAGAPGAGRAATFEPLKPSDYITPTGTRAMAPRVGPVSTAPPLSRRPATEGPPEGGRRDSAAPSRPSNLPKVAAPPPPAARSLAPTRPAAAGPKVERPVKSWTREEMLAAMRSGQLKTTPQGPGTSPPGGGPRPGQAERGTGPGPGITRPAAAQSVPPAPPRRAAALACPAAPRQPARLTRRTNAAVKSARDWDRPPTAPAAARGAASARASVASRHRCPPPPYSPTKTTFAAPAPVSGRCAAVIARRSRRAQVPRRNRAARHGEKSLRGDRRQSQRPDPQAARNEPAHHHQRVAR